LENKPKIGVGVIIVKDNKVLLGKRKGSHGEGTWSFPGGHLEFNETIEDCAVREVKEETNLEINNIRIQTFTNDMFKQEGKHYVTLLVLADYLSGEVKLMESDKCDEWNWFTWDDLPEPLFLPIENLLKQNYSPFD